MKTKKRSWYDDPDQRAKAKERTERMRNSPAGRAKLLILGAKHRGKGAVSVTAEHLIPRLEAGRCEVTGIPFEFGRWPGTAKNPYAPSLDRIDSSKPYSPDNVQVVVWAYNRLKSDDDDFSARFMIQRMALGILEKAHDPRIREHP